MRAGRNGSKLSLNHFLCILVAGWMARVGSDMDGAITEGANVLAVGEFGGNGVEAAVPDEVDAVGLFGAGGIGYAGVSDPADATAGDGAVSDGGDSAVADVMAMAESTRQPNALRHACRPHLARKRALPIDDTSADADSDDWIDAMLDAEYMLDPDEDAQVLVLRSEVLARTWGLHAASDGDGTCEFLTEARPTAKAEPNARSRAHHPEWAAIFEESRGGKPGLDQSGFSNAICRSVPEVLSAAQVQAVWNGYYGAVGKTVMSLADFCDIAEAAQESEDDRMAEFANVSVKQFQELGTTVNWLRLGL